MNKLPNSPHELNFFPHRNFLFTNAYNLHLVKIIIRHEKLQQILMFFN